MSADFPSGIYEPRVVENLPGIVYDSDNLQNEYAEDVNLPNQEIVAIEVTLGTNPQGVYSTVKAWLTALTSALAGKQNSLGFTPENVANKSTSVSTDQASNTKYPSVKAVYDWAVATFQAALGFTPENVANKSTDVALGASDTLYPSQKAVKTYVDNNAGPSKNFFNWWSDVSLPFGVTVYLLQGNYSSAESNCKIYCPIGGTFKNLYVQIGDSVPGSGALTITMRKNGADQTLLKSVPAGSAAGVYSDTTHSFTVAAGDYVTIKAVSAYTSSSSNIKQIALEFDPS